MNKNIKSLVIDEFSPYLKVGDRVSARRFMGIESLGTVIYVEEEQDRCFDVLVKFDTWRRGHDGDLYYQKFNLDYDEKDTSHWWFNDNELELVGTANE